MTILQWVSVAVATTLFVSSDALSSRIWTSKSIVQIAGVLVIACGACVFFGYVSKTVPLAVTSTVINVGVVIGGILVGCLIKGEKLDWHYIVVVVVGVALIAFVAFRPLLVDESP